jgi:hypothetical protein
VRVTGDAVVLRWVARAGPPEAPPDGRPCPAVGVLTGVTRGRLVGGRIAESWTSWDRDGALQRLGFLRSAGSAAP